MAVKEDKELETYEAEIRRAKKLHARKLPITVPNRYTWHLVSYKPGEGVLGYLTSGWEPRDNTEGEWVPYADFKRLADAYEAQNG